MPFLGLMNEVYGRQERTIHCRFWFMLDSTDPTEMVIRRSSWPQLSSRCNSFSQFDLTLVPGLHPQQRWIWNIWLSWLSYFHILANSVWNFWSFIAARLKWVSQCLRSRHASGDYEKDFAWWKLKGLCRDKRRQPGNVICVWVWYLICPTSHHRLHIVNQALHKALVWHIRVFNRSGLTEKQFCNNWTVDAQARRQP